MLKATSPGPKGATRSVNDHSGSYGASGQAKTRLVITPSG